jgi:hypothetical protein
MTEQERQLISGLGDRIRSAPAPQIDRDAYDLILHTIGTRTDALYILTQTVLIQEMALNQAKAQIEELKRQPESYSGAPQQGSFLPGGAPAAGGYSGGGYQGSSYAQGPNYSAPPPPPPPQQQSGGGFSGFLHNAAQTAAGVVAGEVAFDAISSLFGHRGGFFGGGGGGFFGGGGVSPGSETIINNYYDDDRDRGDGRGDSRGDGDSRFAQAADQDNDISPDIDDERDNSGDDFSSGDDDSSSDDGGSSDS